MPKTTQELNYNFFMESDVSQYIGEWIAICENKIVSHGKDIKEVAKIAKALCPGKKIMFARVPDNEAMIF
ncbi:succinyl-CoA synthetase subunit alpha [Candidatus Pacearchaeota archaeon]|nr:succinyl-CoA synthetase subunit alpha [Candidatus Pacearchaeota archaeon]